MNKIFLYRVHRLNIVNMFLGMMYLSAENLHSYCPARLYNKFVILDNSQFVTDCETQTNTNFRIINWASHINWLDQYLNSQNQDLTIGSHLDETLDLLKPYYGSRCVTTCFNYTTTEYPYLLRHLADYHIALLDNNVITPNSVDLEYATFGYDCRLEYYIESFEQQNLLPKEYTKSADIIINIRDLTNIDKIENYLKLYNYTMSDRAQEFYNQWYKQNQNFFI